MYQRPFTCADRFLIDLLLTINLEITVLEQVHAMFEAERFGQDLNPSCENMYLFVSFIFLMYFGCVDMK